MTRHRIEPFLIAFLTLAIVGIVVAVVFAVLYFTTSPAITVSVNGAVVENNVSGVRLPKSADFEIRTVDGKPHDYDVRIYSVVSENNFAFRIDDEQYRWNDLPQNTDLTDAFDVERSESSFSVSYTDMAGILQKRYAGHEITLDPMTVRYVDYFMCRITSGDATFAFTFGFEPIPTQVEISGQIVI